MRHIALTRGKFAIVDAADYEWLNRHRWNAFESGGKFYARRSVLGGTILMHRAIMETPPGMVVDALQVTVRYAESMSETRYLLMLDGAVYKWEYDRGLYGSLGTLALCLIFGLVLAVVAVIVLWLYKGLRRSRSTLRDE